MTANQANPEADDAPHDAAPAARKRTKNKRRFRWLKRGALGLLVAAVAAMLVVSWLPKPLPVDIVALERGPMRVTVDEDGRARVRDRYVVSSPLSGRLARIELDPGQAVSKGDIIARIAPVDSPLLDVRTKRTTEAQIAAARAAKGQTKAQIARAEASLAFATAEVERVEKLVKGQAIAPQALDQALLTKRTTAADLESLKFAALVADHELEMARATLSRTEGDGEQLDIPAPVDGRVLRLIQNSEGVVQAGTPLIELGDPSALEVVVDVLTSDAVDVRPGAKVSVDRWGGKALAAQVRMIEPSAFTRLSALGVEEQRVNVIIDLDGTRDDWAALGDGYRVEAKVVVWESDDVLAIPASAVFRHDKSWAVYRVVDNKAVLTPLEIGHRNALSVEVTAGIELPASVIAQPSDRVQNGLEVVAR
jgi:HlyD family secretion protein